MLPVLQFTVLLLSVGERLSIESAFGKVPGLWSLGICTTKSSWEWNSFLRFWSTTCRKAVPARTSKSSRYIPPLLFASWHLRSFKHGVLTPLLLFSDWLLSLLDLAEKESPLLTESCPMFWRSPLTICTQCMSFKDFGSYWRTGPLISKGPVLPEPFSFPCTPFAFSVSMRFRKVFALVRVGFSFFRLSLGDRAVFIAVDSCSSVLSTSCWPEQSQVSLAAPLMPDWLLLSLPPLLSLWIDETSGSLRSVRTLSLLVVFFILMSPEDPCLSDRWSNASMSSTRDHRLLVLWKVHLLLIAQRSSSSESSLWKTPSVTC